ncbi:hypothetical protein JOJ86_007434 [Rhodococcus percolatus]|uniref:hypothetical protein n=1 Tax=Rhodococcus opacus TaxID=37919 RepID=UPI0015F94D94|nr:hypothetical protein [Rhodococcus opacus]MBA8965068.1 hypothetical protein [Rhodococcus opacus]MBP2209641.1 hypothetical protein [Rhodococcus opacus]
MWMWLAVDEASKGWSDYLAAFGPIAVLSVGLITGWVAIRNARKSPHDRLETLIKVHKDWPEDVDGLETVTHSITLALADIRRTEKHPVPTTLTEEQAAAEAEVRKAGRVSVQLVVGAVAIATTIVGGLNTLTGAAGDVRITDGWVVAAGVSVAALGFIFSSAVGFYFGGQEKRQPPTADRQPPVHDQVRDEGSAPPVG